LPFLLNFLKLAKGQQVYDQKGKKPSETYAYLSAHYPYSRTYAIAFRPMNVQVFGGAVDVLSSTEYRAVRHASEAEGLLSRLEAFLGTAHAKSELFQDRATKARTVSS